MSRKFWNGTEWVSRTRRFWNGTSWVPPRDTQADLSVASIEAMRGLKGVAVGTIIHVQSNNKYYEVVDDSSLSWKIIDGTYISLFDENRQVVTNAGPFETSSFGSTGRLQNNVVFNTVVLTSPQGAHLTDLELDGDADNPYINHVTGTLTNSRVRTCLEVGGGTQFYASYHRASSSKRIVQRDWTKWDLAEMGAEPWQVDNERGGLMAGWVTKWARMHPTVKWVKAPENYALGYASGISPFQSGITIEGSPNTAIPFLKGLGNNILWEDFRRDFAGSNRVRLGRRRPRIHHQPGFTGCRLINVYFDGNILDNPAARYFDEADQTWKNDFDTYDFAGSGYPHFQNSPTHGVIVCDGSRTLPPNNSFAIVEYEGHLQMRNFWGNIITANKVRFIAKDENTVAGFSQLGGGSRALYGFSGEHNIVHLQKYVANSIFGYKSGIHTTIQKFIISDPDPGRPFGLGSYGGDVDVFRTEDHIEIFEFDVDCTGRTAFVSGNGRDIKVHKGILRNVNSMSLVARTQGSSRHSGFLGSEEGNIIVQKTSAGNIRYTRSVAADGGIIVRNVDITGSIYTGTAGSMTSIARDSRNRYGLHLHKNNFNNDIEGSYGDFRPDLGSDYDLIFEDGKHLSIGSYPLRPHSSSSAPYNSFEAHLDRILRRHQRIMFINEVIGNGNHDSWSGQHGNMAYTEWAGYFDNCVTPQGETTEDDGTFVTTSADVGKTFIDIPTTLIWGARQVEATVASNQSAPTVTAVTCRGRHTSRPLYERPYNSSVGSPWFSRPVVRVELNRAIASGEVLTINWYASVTPDNEKITYRPKPQEGVIDFTGMQQGEVRQFNLNNFWQWQDHTGDIKPQTLTHSVVDVEKPDLLLVSISGSTLIVEATQELDSGYFEIRAQDQYGTCTDHRFTVRVSPAPVSEDQYVRTFENDTLNARPNDFTASGSHLTYNGQVMEKDGHRALAILGQYTNNRRTLIWRGLDGVPGKDNAEIVLTVWAEDGYGGGNRLGPMLRYTDNYFYANLVRTNSDNQIRRWEPGSQGTPTTSLTGNLSVPPGGAWVNLGLRVETNGDEVKVYASQWLVGTSKPSNWQLVGQDEFSIPPSEDPETGDIIDTMTDRVGILWINAEGGFFIRSITVGVNGKSAPLLI
jgi:hypothetical protein